MNVQVIQMTVSLQHDVNEDTLKKILAALAQDCGAGVCRAARQILRLQGVSVQGQKLATTRHAEGSVYRLTLSFN